MGQSPRDLFVSIDVRPVRGRCDRGHPLVATFRRLADGLDRHAVGLLGQEVPVAGKALVVNEDVVFAKHMPKLLLRRGELGLRANGASEEEKSEEQAAACDAQGCSCGNTVTRGHQSASVF